MTARGGVMKLGGTAMTIHGKGTPWKPVAVPWQAAPWKLMAVPLQAAPGKAAPWQYPPYP